MIDFQCPHCRARFRVPKSAAGKKGTCNKCGKTIRVPEARPESPRDSYERTEKLPVPTLVPPPESPKNQPKGPRELPPVDSVALGRDQWIAIACGTAGLALLAASAWLPWMNVFTGSISGIGTLTGKIVFGVSLTAGLAVATAYTLKKLWVHGALAASAWGTISTLWLGSLLYKVATIMQDSVQDENLRNNPFAKVLATQFSPGFGLYVAPVAGLLVSGSFGYIAFQQAANTKSHHSKWFLIGAQIVAIVVGLGGIYAAEPTVSRRENDDAVASAGKPASPIPANPFANMFPEETREGKQAEVRKLERKKTDANQAMQKLKQFQILRARFYVEKNRFDDLRIIELDVKNGTHQAVRRAYFRGTLQTPGRAIPWARGTFDHDIKGGLEPGERAEWKLHPYEGEFEWADEKPNMVLNVEVVRLDGPNGEPFLQANWGDDDQKKLDTLKKALGDGK